MPELLDRDEELERADEDRLDPELDLIDDDLVLDRFEL